MTSNPGLLFSPITIGSLTLPARLFKTATAETRASEDGFVTDAVRVIGFQNAIDLVRGGPTAATSYLRGSMGSRLIDAMVPELGQAMRVAQDPLVGELLAGDP